MKQIWIPDSKIMPLVKSVLFEKTTTINKDGESCFFLNGVEVIVIYADEESFQPDKFGRPKIYGCKKRSAVEKNTLMAILVANCPIELITTDSKILWRLSKLIFRAKAYYDCVNNKIITKKIDDEEN